MTKMLALVLPRQGEVARAQARDGGVNVADCRRTRYPLSHRIRDDSSPYRVSTTVFGAGAE